MYDDELKGAKRLRYWMYRALGKSDTQARWQLRQSSKSQPSKRVHRHRHCDQCNQLLLLSDAQCHRCGATQVAPSWLLQLSRSVKVEPETVIPIIVGTCLLGYLVQVSMGCSLFGGLASAPPIIQVQVLDVGAIKPTRRGLARQCLDWTERRHHLAGPLGVRFLAVLCENGWMQRSGTSRAIVVTPLGWSGLESSLGITTGML